MVSDAASSRSLYQTRPAAAPADFRLQPQRRTSFEERLRGKTDEHKATDVQQKLALAQFIEEEFHDANSGVNVRAFHSFDQPTTFAKQLRTHLTNLLESSYGVELERPYWNVADLLIDQMEELFSSATQTPESIEQFFEVLEDLARSGCVWIVATVSSDFYHECQKVSALVRMKDGSGQYDLLPPASDSLMRVVTGPAHLAGLRFEKDGEQSLADLIIRESAGCAELLPLVEYLLLDLFEHRTADSVLTFARYRELGGLEGALRHRCEDTFARLSTDAQDALPAVLSKLVTLSGDDLNTAVRRAVPWERFQPNPTELAFIDAMVAQRLFTTYSDSDGTKVVSVTHEAVLRIWPRVSQWTDQNRGFLRIRSRVEQSQSRWKQQQDDSLLLAKGVPLSEGCQLLDEAPHLLDPDTKAYIERSSAFHKAESLRRQRIRIGTAVLAGMLVIGISWYAWGVRNRILAEGVVNSMLAANPVELERLIDKELPNHRSIANGLLRTLSAENLKPESKPGLHARLASLAVDKTVLKNLQETLITIPEPEYLALIVRTIKANQLTADLWPQFHDSVKPLSSMVPNSVKPLSSMVSTQITATLEPDYRFSAGLALASLEPDASQWTDADASFLVERLVQSNPIHQATYLELLTPISQRLIEPLRVVFTAETSNQVQQLASANAIAAFAKNQPDLLPEFLTVATPEQYDILFPGLANSEIALKSLMSIVRTEPMENLPQSDRISLGIRRAGAAITLLRTGEREGIFDVFRVTKDPESLSQFVARCKARGATVSQLLECVDVCDLKRQTLTGADRTLEDRVLFGQLLALGDYSRDAVPEPKQEPLKTRLAKWYETDPSATVHGATGWLLRRWGYSDEVSKVDSTSLPYDPTGLRDWFTLEVKVAEQPLCFTFIVFPAGEYQLGSPTDESKRTIDEAIHSIKLSRPVAICDRELTWAQFDPSDDGEWHKGMDEQFARKSKGDDPAFGRNWFDSVTYCRWLSSQMGLDEASQCYDDPAKLEKDEQGNPKYSEIYVERTGFRLPTEAEWEVVSRAGTQSAYTFGSDSRLLESYGWFQQNSSEWSHTTAELRPNLNGLYDVHGNLLEWCHDWYADYDVDIRDPVGPSRGSDRVCRGGGWSYQAAFCRSAYRFTFTPSVRDVSLGFRLVLSPSSESSSKEAEPVGGGSVCGAATGDAVACWRSGE